MNECSSILTVKSQKVQHPMNSEQTKNVMIDFDRPSFHILWPFGLSEFINTQLLPL